MDRHEQSTSVWMATAEQLPEQPLTQDQRGDVCVVGAGIAGLSTAYMLARAGKSVIVVDGGPVGSGQTQRTTAHLSNALDDRYFEVEKVHGEVGARLAAESHSAAINRIEEIVRLEKLACDFQRVDGYLFNPPEEKSDLLEREWQAAHRAGLTDVEFVARAPIPSFDTGRCLRFPQQGQFHPLKYLAGLAAAIKRKGGKIYTQTQVTKVEGGSETHVTTRNGPTVTANAVVVATNTPINDIVTIHTKQAPYLTYAIGATVPAGAVPRALYWDTLEFYHYIRLQPDQDGKEVAHRGGRGSQGRPGRRSGRTLATVGRMGARPLSHDGPGRLSLVRNGHGNHRRPGLHRSQPRR